MFLWAYSVDFSSNAASQEIYLPFNVAESDSSTPGIQLRNCKLSKLEFLLVPGGYPSGHIFARANIANSRKNIGQVYRPVQLVP